MKCQRSGNAVVIVPYAGDSDEERSYDVKNDPSNPRGALWLFKNYRPKLIRSSQFGSFVFRFAETSAVVRLNGDGVFTVSK
jgi:hypothetical protein